MLSYVSKEKGFVFLVIYKGLEIFFLLSDTLLILSVRRKWSSTSTKVTLDRDDKSLDISLSRTNNKDRVFSGDFYGVFLTVITIKRGVYNLKSVLSDCFRGYSGS